MRDTLEQFVDFAVRMAPARDQRLFRDDLETWLRQLDADERAKITAQVKLGKPLNRATLAPGIGARTHGLSGNCIPIARQMLDLFHKKGE